MTSISATALRKDLYNIIAQINENCAPIAITNTKGKGAVLVGEDEWAAIEETLYLMGIPGMAQSLIDGRDTPIEECVGESALEWRACGTLSSPSRRPKTQKSSSQRG